MPELYDHLLQLNESDLYPFHMPGHKRNVKAGVIKDISKIDITEIDGFDNLHDAHGIIAAAQIRANRLYGADETFFLVNGSSCGVLAAVSAVMNQGDCILAARASHKSFYHAAYLKHLRLKYLDSGNVQGYEFPDAVTAKEIEKKLDSAVRAVFITSPTYEGIPADIAEIAEVVHSYGIPLIVDEAHGAHFGFTPEVPDSAVHQGADLVIHSVHKTLPSMTQTALLHVQGKLVNRERLRRYLRIYQSSSPSYVFMASIDLCMEMLEKNRKDWFGKLIKYHDFLCRQTDGCGHLHIPDESVIPDPCKIVIAIPDHSITGQELYEVLREKYHLQMEMAGAYHVLAIISGNDTEEGIRRLADAVNEIDASVSTQNVQKHMEVIKIQQSRSERPDRSGNRSERPEESGSRTDQSGGSTEEQTDQITENADDTAMSLYRAWDAETELIPIENAVGRTAGEFINLYPPGTPLIVPGERFERKLLQQLQIYIDNGMNLQGIETDQNKDSLVTVIRETEDKG
ncbi:MAG: aminotransferase class V-fold PLP-dependent enzyme [Butyrivibrio sp.]|nr:aminotransferase class V-fold PLP-dependent enzyme [Butyrivibrio sp.]